MITEPLFKHSELSFLVHPSANTSRSETIKKVLAIFLRLATGLVFQTAQTAGCLVIYGLHTFRACFFKEPTLDKEKQAILYNIKRCNRIALGIFLLPLALANPSKAILRFKELQLVTAPPSNKFMFTKSDKVALVCLCLGSAILAANFPLPLQQRDFLGRTIISLGAVSTGMYDLMAEERHPYQFSKGVFKILSGLTVILPSTTYLNHDIPSFRTINNQEKNAIDPTYENHDTSDSSSENTQGASKNALKKKITFGTTYVNLDNHERNDMSLLVNENHNQYAKKWNLDHRPITTNLVKNMCTQGWGWFSYDCTPHWNKVKILKDWLHTPLDSEREEWYILPDDDMPVMNMQINPDKAINVLRQRDDQSIIIAKDAMRWSGNSISSINTGLLIVRKDETAKEIIDLLWEKRNSPAFPWDHPSYTICPTLGICKEQKKLHEQEGLKQIIEEYPRLTKLMAIVNQREKNSSPRAHIALNTFERSGSFNRQEKDWISSCFSYGDDEEWSFQEGDWFTQATGVPIMGRVCRDNQPTGPLEPLRLNKIKNLLSQVVR